MLFDSPSLRETPRITPLRLQGNLYLVVFFYQISVFTDYTLKFKQLSICTNFPEYNSKKYKNFAKTKHRRASMPSSAPLRHAEFIKTGHMQTDSADQELLRVQCSLNRHIF